MKTKKPTLREQLSNTSADFFLKATEVTKLEQEVRTLKEKMGLLENCSRLDKRQKESAESSKLDILSKIKEIATALELHIEANFPSRHYDPYAIPRQEIREETSEERFLNGLLRRLVGVGK